MKTEVERSGVESERKKRIDRIFEKDVGESLRYMQTAVTRAAAIIDALLRLSRAGRVEYQRKEVDVASVARRVVDALQATIKEKGASVSIGALPSAAGDPTAIEQVLANFVVNALNYLQPTRPGEIEIGARPDVNEMNVYFVKGQRNGDPQAPISERFSLHFNVCTERRSRAKESAWRWCGAWRKGRAERPGLNRKRELEALSLYHYRSGKRTDNFVTDERR